MNRGYEQDEIKHLGEKLNELRQALDQNQHNFEEFDVSKFRRQAQSEIQRLSTRLTEPSSKVDAVGKALHELQDYRYQFNVKIINVPEIKQEETAREASDLCVALFNGMGAVVSLQDLDVAHRVSRRDQGGSPKSIIWKFIRRLGNLR